MPRRSLKDVVSALPSLGFGPLTEEIADAGLSTTVLAPSGYVWPDLDIDAQTLDSPVLLVSAPGAMGKSMASRAVAAALSAPRVDLSRLRVGNDTLTGLLTRVLGWAQAPALITALQSGDASLVLDGLDEAQLLAGREHFLAFIRNVADLVRPSSVGRGQLVILGRRDAVDTAFLALLDEGIDATRATIAPLTYSQSVELIDVTLDARRNGHSYSVHRQHPEPFAQLREAVFTEIASALLGDEMTPWSLDRWHAVDHFLGYPPVLMVLAQWLAVDNPSAELGGPGQLTSGDSKRGRGQLLRQVVEGILDRESGKVRTQLAGAFGWDSSDKRRSILYTREEQCLRLLRYMQIPSLVVDMPAGLEPAERASYEEQVEAFVPDHPFLADRQIANVVFGDYLRAFVATPALKGLHGAEPADLLGAAPPAGPFFVHFVHGLAPGEIAEIWTEDLADELLKSFFAGASGTPFAFYRHDEDGCRFEFVEDVTRENSPRLLGLRFRVKEPSGVLVLTSPVIRTLVTSLDGGVVVSSVGENIELGPDVAIIAADVELRGNAVDVTGHEGTDDAYLPGVGIFAKAISHEPSLRVSSNPESALTVAWPNMWHQWKPYQIKRKEKGLNPFFSDQLLLGLRRILLAFHGGAGEQPSVYGEKLDRLIIGSNPFLELLLLRLLELGILSRTGPLYILNTAALAQFGVSYEGVRGSDFADVLESLHTEVCKGDDIQEVQRALKP